MSNPEGLLSPYLVVDLCGPTGALAGSILSSMGAEVIRIEPPGGCSLRGIAPFLDVEGEEKLSLPWIAFSRGKKSVQLDLDQAEGRSILSRLLKSADILLDDFGAGDARDAPPLDLAKDCERLVHVSITPFGAAGPRAGWQATDLIVQASGGHMYLSGDHDLPPVRLGVPVSRFHGASEAVAAAMIGIHSRNRTGKGCRIDVSMQQCLVWTLLNTTMTWQLNRRQEMRGGEVRRERGNTIYTRVLWRCRDGAVLFVPVGGGGGAARVRSLNALLNWMEEDEVDVTYIKTRDWNGRDMHDINQEEHDTIAEIIRPFLESKTVEELYQGALNRKILLAPINSVADICGSQHLAAREFFTDADAGDRKLRSVGAFAKFSESPLMTDGHVPELGADTIEILNRLGYSQKDYEAFKSAGIV